MFILSLFDHHYPITLIFYHADLNICVLLRTLIRRSHIPSPLCGGQCAARTQCDAVSGGRRRWRHSGRHRRRLNWSDRGLNLARTTSSALRSWKTWININWDIISNNWRCNHGDRGKRNGPWLWFNDGQIMLVLMNVCSNLWLLSISWRGLSNSCRIFEFMWTIQRDMVGL